MTRSRQWMQHLRLVSPSLFDEDDSGWERYFAQIIREFQELTSKYPFPVETSSNDDNDYYGSSDSTYETRQQQQQPSLDLDPLSAMLAEQDSRNERLQQLEMKYRKERAQRKRGLFLEGRNHNNNTSSFVDGTTEGEEECEDEQFDQNIVALQIIDKDLDRLALPNHPTAEQVCLSSRKETLRQMLYVFSCSHPESGYRQGMHEVASYCYFILEMEFAADNNHNQAVMHESESTSLAAPAYAILSAVLTALFPAYDVVASTPPLTIPSETPDNFVTGNTTTAMATTNKKPLEHLSWSVLDLLSKYDPTLWQMITSTLNIPPQLIFAKWIRLLFSREVDAVVEFLDEMMQMIPSVSTASTDNHSSSNSLLFVTEAATVARLILHRSELLVAEPSDALHFIMNLPKEREEQFDLFVQFMRKIAKRERISLPAIDSRQIDNSIPLVSSSSPPQRRDNDGMYQSQSSSYYHHHHHPQAQHPHTPMMHETHHHSHGGGVHGSTTALAGFSLSSVKEKLAVHTEKLAAQTQSIGKRLYHEWETTITAANRNDHDNQQPNYGDPTVARIVTFDDPLGAHANKPTVSPPAALPHYSGSVGIHPAEWHQWSSTLDRNVRVLHQFCIEIERGGKGNVPANVWAALSSLEALRHELDLSSKEQNPK